MTLTNQDRLQTEQGKLSVLLALTLCSVTLFRFVELPTLNWGVLSVLGSPLEITFGGDVLLVLLVVGLIATGTLTVIQTHPRREQSERPLIFSLITPALGGLLFALLLIQAAAWPLWLGALILGGITVGFLVHLSYRVISPENPGYPAARTLLNIIDYLVGFTLFSLILSEQGRALVTGPAVLILTALLGLDLLSSSGVQSQRILPYAGALALLIGELAWVIGYWLTAPWTAATLLTLVLYVGIGLSYQHILGQLTRQVALEFAGVGLVMFILVLWIHP
jgi:hypothetical protein